MSCERSSPSSGQESSSQECHSLARLTFVVLVLMGGCFVLGMMVWPWAREAGQGRDDGIGTVSPPDPPSSSLPPATVGALRRPESGHGREDAVKSASAQSLASQPTPPGGSSTGLDEPPPRESTKGDDPDLVVSREPDIEEPTQWEFRAAPYARVFIDGQFECISGGDGVSRIGRFEGPHVVNIVLPSRTLVEIEWNFSTGRVENRHEFPLELPREVDYETFLAEGPRFLKIDLPNEDAHGNPIETRDHARVDPRTGLPYEIWLDLTSIIPKCPILEFVLVPAQVFLMGSRDAAGYKSEMPAHSVKIRRPFYMAKYEVTQGFWAAVGGEIRSSLERTGDDKPVEVFDWVHCQEATLRLTRIIRSMTNGPLRSGMQIRLPSEAEFECACRGGGNGPRCFGESPQDLAEHCWLPSTGLHPVGMKKPNPYGQYDMHGNLPEWCEDTWNPDYSGAPSDGSSRLDGEPEPAVARGFCDRGQYKCSLRYPLWRRGLGWPPVGVRFVLSICFAEEK
jgi:hypothetical protein